MDIEAKDQTIRQILQDIEAKSEYRFFYNDQLANLDDKVDFSAENKSEFEAIEELFHGTELTFKVMENNLVLIMPASLMQQPGIFGTITDENGEPLPGVSIFIKGTTRGAISDLEGKYTIEVGGPEVVLVYSYVGMLTQEIQVGDQTEINVTLSADVLGLDEVVVVGYGTQKKSSVTGAIATMAAEEVKDLPTPNLSNALAGRMSGVFVTQASGIPGYAADIRVRSVNTWKSAGNEPLYVIDGVIADKQSFDALDYSEVENISVLKDAASGAVYGARGANGVILVTTRTGRTGKFTLDYNFTYSFDRPTKLTDYQTSGEAVLMNNYANAVAGAAPFADDQEVAYYQQNDPAKDYFDKAYQDPVLMRHTLTGSGGTERIKYFVGASYFDQTGFIETTGFNKYNIRTNLDIDFTDDLSGEFKFSYNEGVTSRFSFQEDMASTFEPQATGGNLIGRLQYYMAFTRPTTSDGKYIDPGWIGNPLAFVQEGGTNEATNNNTDLLIGLNYKIPVVQGLSVAAKFSRNYSLQSIKHYEVKPTVYQVVREGTNGRIYTDEIISSRKTSYPSKEELGQRQITNKSYQLNLSANYARTFGDHNVNALFVYERAEGFNNLFYGVRENFPLFQKDQFWASGASREDSYVDGSDYEYGRASYIGRLSYDYGNKYFLNATIRHDGSMLFAPDYRWGTFPSVSVGWVLTNEEFLQSNVLNFLKLRATYGLAGNDAVGGWEWQESYSTNGSFMIGESSQPRVRYNGIVNAELTWEKTSEFNIGFDSRFLQGIIFNFEYFNRHNYDILDSRIVSLPASFGGSMPPVNYGVVDAQGVEFEAGYSGRAGDFSYRITGNLSYAANKVKEKDIPENVRDVDNPLGRSTDYVACLVSTGIIRTQAELDALPDGYTIFGKAPALGALNFEDVSGLEPGVPDGKIDNYDRQVIEGKHYLPPYTYGLNLSGDWRGFGVDIFFHGVLGVSKMYNDGYGRRFHTGVRAPAFWNDSWTPQNTGAPYPQAVTWNYTWDHQASTFWLKSGNYFRMGYLNLYYSLPKSIVQKIWMSNLRILVSGTNLFTISPFEYYDPTVAETRSYPTMKTYTLGVNVTF
jgi:TonB-linked SusC/RagA family outer membrane protein